MTQRHSGHSCDILLTSPLRDSGDYRAIQIQRMIKRSRRSVSGTSSSASRLFNYIYQVVGSERLAVQRDLAFDRRELSLSPSLPLSLSLSLSPFQKKNHSGWIFTGEKIRWYAAWRASYINEQTLPSSQGRAVIIVRSLPRSITLFFPLDLALYVQSRRKKPPRVSAVTLERNNEKFHFVHFCCSRRFI